MSTNTNIPQNLLELDAYQIYDSIGAGGGGTIFLAFHKRLQKQVVIKKIHEKISDKVDQRTEVDILKNLHHPYLPQVFDYFVVDGVGYTVMDFIQGESLGQKLKQGMRFKEARILKYSRQLCEAVDYLHSQAVPIIHGDIKPDNIMITPEDNICLIDFNISGVFKDGKAVTNGFSKGYSAPEQYEEYQRWLTLVRGGQAGAAHDGKKNVPIKYTDDDKTEVLDAYEDDDKTEVLDTYADDDKTEVLEAYTDDDKTEVLEAYADDDKTEVLQTESSVHSGANTNAAKPKLEITIDKRSDVYSIGATMFHLCCGARIDKCDKAVLKAGTSEGLVYILNQALQNDPSKRYKNAGEMLQALQSIHKQDKRYRRMIAVQNAVRILLVLLAIGGVFMINIGRMVLKEEQESCYAAYITDMDAARVENNADAFQTQYEEALALFPERLDAYYQKTLYLYEQKKYEEAITYIENDVLSVAGAYETKEIADVYYILGNSYFELGYYTEAENALATAIKYNGENAAFYVDRAISLARLGKTSEADASLQSAEALGIEDDMLYLVQGEIDLALDHKENAITNFKACIAATDDDYVKLRSYIMLSNAYQKGESTQTNVDENLAFLDTALQELPMDYHLLLLEEQVKICIAASAAYEDVKYEDKAIEVLNKVVNMGWGTFTTYNNLVILYQKKGDLENALSCLQKMSADYPDNYNVAKRFAFLEIEIQGEKEETDRDYSTFLSYYEQAKTLYEEQAVENKTDAEMQLLDNAYQQLIDGNWIK